MKYITVYPQLAAQMAMKGWNGVTLSEKTGIEYQTLCRKLRGGSRMSLDEAKRIQAALNCGLTLDELFVERVMAQ